MGEGEDEGESPKCNYGCYKYIPYNNHSYIFRIDPHAAFAAPDDDKNIYLNPSLRGI